jgi:predicted PurR-regulated permease PerM
VTERVRRAGQVSWAAVGVAALLAVVGLVFWTVRVIFPPLVLAGAIVFLLNPIAADQASELGDDWPEIKKKAEGWIDDAAETSQGTFFEFTREELEDAFGSDDTSFRQQLDQARDLGFKIFHVLLILLLAPIIAFYLLVDAPRVREVMRSLVPPGAKDEVDHVAHRLNRAIGGFFRGQLLVATIVGVMCSVGLLIIGLRFWFLVGMIAGLFNVIPLIGPWVGGVPGIIIALTTGTPLQALGVVLVMVIAQQVDNHFITPQVMQRVVQLHPAAVILALLAGGSLGGFFGLLLAVPAAAVLKIICGHVWRVHILNEPFEQAVKEEDEAEGPGLVEDVVDLEGGQDRQATDPVPAQGTPGASEPDPETVVRG